MITVEGANETQLNKEGSKTKIADALEAAIDLEGLFVPVESIVIEVSGSERLRRKLLASSLDVSFTLVMGVTSSDPGQVLTVARSMANSLQDVVDSGDLQSGLTALPGLGITNLDESLFAKPTDYEAGGTVLPFPTSDEGWQQWMTNVVAFVFAILVAGVIYASFHHPKRAVEKTVPMEKVPMGSRAPKPAPTPGPEDCCM